jgi:hypothetical protein
VKNTVQTRSATVKRSSIFVLVLAVMLAAGCNSRTDKSEGSVILSVTDFDGLPNRVRMNNLDFTGVDLLTIDSIDIDNIPKDPNGTTSDLQNVEMRSYEVVYTRADTGTVVPPPLVESVFGVAPVGGSVTYDNLAIMRAQQLTNPPLSDLLLLNGGIDSETGSPVITITFTMRFFGRTLAGDDVATAPIRFDVEFVP